jgi:hypothetical protein
MENKPIEISGAEWREIMEVPDVREGWGIEKNESVEDFRSMVYGVKFDFMSGGPGYVGDLYIVLGDALEPPLVLIRKDGTLEAA